jgi:molybdopterin-containing oxidoreductase family membrane subunit
MIQAIKKDFDKNPLFGGWVTLLIAMILIGVFTALNVLFFGLQITNLSDQVPWGLWITIDLSAIALGAGAFSLSAMVYLLGIESLRPIARIAVFTGLIGYTAAMVALFMDIGRPERFWHPLIYWNLHSVLWEITICVMLYATVLITEFAPTVLESDFMKRIWPGGPRVGHFLHKFAPFAAVLGLALSLLHQSSLGATYGVLVARPIWFKPSLPVMFILSAVASGSVAILGIVVLYENFKRERQIPMRTRNALAMFGGMMLLAYLYLNLWDYLATNYYSHLPARVEAIELLNRVAPYGTSFWLIEILLGVVIPAVILLTPALRKRDGLVMMAAVLVIAGIVVNRWNVTLSGLIVPLDWSPGVADVFPVNAYRPSWVEWGVASLVIGYVLLAFTLALRFLPFFPRESSH